MLERNLYNMFYENVKKYPKLHEKSEKKGIFPQKPVFTVWTFFEIGCKIKRSMW